ncbi:Phosphatidylinositol 3-kinase piki-1 [Bienertia sinuspersici]
MGRGRGRGRIRGRGRGAMRSLHPDASVVEMLHSMQATQPTPIETQTSQSEVVVLHTPNLPTPRASPLIRKRVPKTTAKRRDQIVNSVVIGSSSASKKRKTTAAKLGDDLGQDLVMHNESDDSEDEVYFPSDSEKTNDEDGDIDDDLVEEGDEDEYMEMIHGDFDPYEGGEDYDGIDDFGDDNYIQRIYKNGDYYKDEEFGRITIMPWQLYTDKMHLRHVVRDYCIQSGFSVVVERANNTRYTIRCSDLRWQWRLHASRLPDGVTWAIKSIQNPEHTCLGLETRNSMVSARWAARVLLDVIRANNGITSNGLNELLWRRYKVEMDRSSLYRVKTIALGEIHGSYDISYSYLPGYCEVIRATNPGSDATCSWMPHNHPERPLSFNTIFVAFRGALDGLFAGCRGLIGIDGAFLKENWKFFVWHLKQVLAEGGRGINGALSVTDTSDYWVQAIEKACTTVWPTVGRRYCCKHLSVNWKKVFPGPKMWQLFWLATSATSAFTFKKAMQAIEKHKPAVRLWLANHGEEQDRWSKHKFNTDLKCDVNKTNFVESFNSTLGVDRQRPVLTLLEGIRRVTMVRIAIRRQVCERWEICPKIIKRVQKLCSESRMCRAYPSKEGEYEIVDGKSNLAVSLNNHTCQCNAWQLTGIPCKHGMRAILHAELDPHTFVREWYTIKRYKMAYDHGINSLPDMEQWPHSNMPTIQPPPIHRGVGRPCRERKRGDDEERKGKRSKTIRCAICKEFGHNKLTCKGGSTNKQNKSKKKAKNESGTKAPDKQEHGPTTSNARK